MPPPDHPDDSLLSPAAFDAQAVERLVGVGHDRELATARVKAYRDGGHIYERVIDLAEAVNVVLVQDRESGGASAGEPAGSEG